MENIWKIPKKVLKENYREYKLNPANLLMNGPNELLDLLFESIVFDSPETLNPIIILDEGLIESFPAEKVRDMFLKAFPDLKESQIQIVDIPYTTGAKKIYVTGIVLLAPNIKEHAKAFEKVARRGGYTLSKIGTRSVLVDPNQKWVTFMFIPDFQKPRNMNDEPYLWHISPKRFEKSILEKGFVPYSKNSEFNYPGRIFFIRGSIPEKKAIELFYKVFEKAPKDPEKTQYIDYSSYVIYKVSTKKAGVKFYVDPDWTDKAVYTTENILPSAIVSKKDIKYN